MKKLFVLLLTMILAAGVAFAQEASATSQETTEEAAPTRQIERMSLEVTIGFPIHWTTGLHNNEFYPKHPDDSTIYMEDRSATANTSIGVALNFNFTRIFGFVIDADFFYGAKIQGFSNPNSDYIALSSANVFIGPVFYLYNNNTFRVPFGISAHMYYFGDDLWVPDISPEPVDGAGWWMNRTEIQFGLGLSLGFQYHFNRDIYVFSRTNVSIDFVRIHSIKEVNDHDGSGTAYREASHTNILVGGIHWTVKPTIGIGMKLN